MAENDIKFEDEFNISVQKKFLSLFVFDQKWAVLNGFEIIKPEYFENRILHNICTWIHEHYAKYKELPTKLILSEKAKNFINNSGYDTKEYYPYAEALNDIFTITDGDNFEFFKEEALKFVRQMAWKKALAKGSRILSNSDNYEQAINEFKKVLSLGLENDLGLDFSVLNTQEMLDLLGEDYDQSSMLKTGIPGWDKALGGGFVKKNVHIIGAPPGGGKAIDVKTPVLTPTSWKQAKEIKVGDYLISQKGLPTKVLAVYPQGIKRNFRVIFNDKSETNCCNEHLWTVYDHKKSAKYRKQPRTLSLDEILELGLYKEINTPSRIKSNRKPAVRWEIPLVEPVQFEEKAFIIHPYNLGALLGDGSLSVSSVVGLSNSSKDIFIKEKFESFLPEGLKLSQKKQYANECEQYHIIRDDSKENTYINEIKRLGLSETTSHNKFIPEEYKFGSVSQRIGLLNGLMDTDGTISKGNRVSFATMSEQLAKDVVELVQSLGGMASINVKKHSSTKKSKGYYEYYDVAIYSPKINPFSLPRKVERWTPTKRHKYIKEVIEQSPREQVCFKVDNEDELFVIENYIVTHNSRIMAYLTKQALMDHKKVIFITLELSEIETMANINTAATGIGLHEMLNPINRKEFEQKRIDFKNKYGSDLMVKFYKPGAVTTDTLHNYIQKVIQYKQETLGIEWKPDVIFIDYMDKLLPTQKIRGNSYEDMGGVANDCKNLGITFECPVITGSQLGRYCWVLNGDAVVSQDSISESAAKVHIAHSMTTVNTNKAEKELFRTRLFMAKSRSGTPGKVIYCENHLGKCMLREIEEWDPNTLTGTSTFTIKDASSRK